MFKKFKIIGIIAILVILASCGTRSDIDPNENFSNTSSDFTNGVEIINIPSGARDMKLRSECNDIGGKLPERCGGE